MVRTISTEGYKISEKEQRLVTVWRFMQHTVSVLIEETMSYSTFYDQNATQM